LPVEICHEDLAADLWMEDRHTSLHLQVRSSAAHSALDITNTKRVPQLQRARGWAYR